MDEGNGMSGKWAAHCAAARPIDVKVKQECLRLFRQGMGFHRVAKRLGLRPYTVRDWLRRFKRLDDSWAMTDGWGHWRRAEARDLVKYPHELEIGPECRLPHDAGDRSGRDTERGVAGGEGQAVGDAEQDSALPPFSAAGAWSAVLAGGCRKKKEIEAVESLVAQGYDRKSACKAAGISRAAYYRAKKASPKSESDAELVELMCRIENDRHVSQTYGVDRLTAEINRQLQIINRATSAKILGKSSRVNRKRTHRLMKLYGVHSRLRRRRHPDNYYKSIDEMLKTNKAPNVLHREFKSARPMRKIATDVTYIPCSDAKFLYLSALLDLFNKEVVSYTMSSINSVEFAIRMVRQLPPELLKDALLHSDQGNLYWSNAWVGLCNELDIVRSMSRRGNCWDNSLCEGFFSHRKSDLGLCKCDYKHLLPERVIRAMIDDYMPWYNEGRIQKKLGYMSPMEYKKAFASGLNHQTQRES